MEDHAETIYRNNCKMSKEYWIVCRCLKYNLYAIWQLQNSNFCNCPWFCSAHFWPIVNWTSVKFEPNHQLRHLIRYMWKCPWCRLSSTCFIALTHWGRVTHICVGNLTIIGPNNGLSPGWRQAIIWTNAGILLIGPWGTNFSEILIGIQAFSFKKMHLKMSSAKWRPFCLGLNVLIITCQHTCYFTAFPNKHARMCRYWIRIETMRTASFQFRFSTGTFWHVYRVTGVVNTCTMKVFQKVKQFIWGIVTSWCLWYLY